MDIADVLFGTICFTHFNPKDLRGANAKMVMKKGAIPKLSKVTPVALPTPQTPPNQQNNMNDISTTCNSSNGCNERSIEMIEYDEYDSNDDCATNDCGDCDILRAEMKNLKEQYFHMESEYKMKVTKLGAKICMLEDKLRTVKKTEAKVKDRLKYLLKSKEKLNNTFKKLQQENNLCKEIYEYVQVVFFIFYA